MPENVPTLFEQSQIQTDHLDDSSQIIMEDFFQSCETESEIDFWTEIVPVTSDLTVAALRRRCELTTRQLEIEIDEKYKRMENERDQPMYINETDQWMKMRPTDQKRSKSTNRR